MTGLAEFLLQRIAEREQRFWPKTVAMAGDVLACNGPDGRGGCRAGTGYWGEWVISPDAPGALDAARAHELTHATPEQRFVLAECESKRRIVDLHRLVPGAVKGEICCEVCGWVYDEIEDFGVKGCETLRLLAEPYSGHPEYRQEWKP